MIRSRLPFCSVLVAVASGLFNGGGGDEPERALPYGEATGAAISCPAGSAASSTCTNLLVVCPSVPAAAAILRVTRPRPAMTNQGTILLTTGGDGTAFASAVSPLAPAMLASLTAAGLVVVEVAWQPPGIWGGPRPRTLACRYATAAKWVYTNVHAGGRTRLFAAQGTSGGASQIAFALAHYGLSDFLDLASLGGGPPGCPRCAPDGHNPPEPLLPADPPAVSREPLLAYPATVVRFFLGDREPTPAIVRDANAYYTAITSAKSFVVVRDTPHTVEQSHAGVETLMAAVRAALK